MSHADGHEDLLSMLDIVIDSYVELSRALVAEGPTVWGRPTPCDEWDVTGLVDHVVGGNQFTLGILAGLDAEEAIANAVASFGAGHADAFRLERSCHEVGAAFRVTGVLDAGWDHVAGELTGAEVLTLRLHDLAVHAWDLGHTVHGSWRLPERLVDWGLAELAEADSLAVRHFGVDPTSLVSGDYLAVFGRMV